VAAVTKPSVRKVEIITATPEHWPLLEAFFKSVWSSGAPSDMGGSAPGGSEARPEPSPSSIAIQDGRVIGYLGTLPLRLWDGQGQQVGHWYKGFMVVPEFRNGPLGFGLVKEAAKHLPITLVITVQPASWRLFQAAGLHHLGALDNRLRLLRPGRVLKLLDPKRIGLGRLPYGIEGGLKIAQRLGLAGIAGAAAGGVLAGWSAVRGSPPKRVTTRAVDTIDAPDYDGLWSRVCPPIRFAQVRDSEYVRRRYAGNHSTYSLIEARDGRELVGFAAVRHPRADADPRLTGLSIAVLSDLLFHPQRRDIALAVLKSAERTALALGADALLCSASHPALLASLTARGYVRIPATLQFLARLDGGRDPGSLSDWWLLRADGNSDEGL
jgi:hypothetical protein